jgi:hypothetical protein
MQDKCWGQALSLEQILAPPGQVSSPAALMTNLCLHWQEALCKLATHFSLVAQTDVAPQGEIHIPFKPSQ